MNKTKEILPGWSFTEEFTVDSEMKISAINTSNYKVEKVNANSSVAYQECLNEAFRIEQSIGKNRNKFFYDILIKLIDDKLVIINDYQETVMDSWQIETKHQRIVLDGKDMVMWLDEKKKKWFKSDWIQIEFFAHLEDLKYIDLIGIANKLNNIPNKS